MIWLSFIVSVFAITLGLGIAILDEATLVDTFGENSEMVAEYASSAVLVLILPLLYERLGEKLHMKKLPKLYVTNGNGVVNAYALSCNTRHKYIVMHAETVMAMEHSPEIVEFVLAHELAHHKLGHVSLWRSIIGVIPNTLIPLGITTTRAQEYSADRVAKSVCDHDHSAMKLLAIGPWMHQNVDSDSWLDECETDRKEFYVRCANVLSSHAVMSKRFKALRDIDAQGFKSHGDMF